MFLLLTLLACDEKLDDDGFVEPGTQDTDSTDDTDDTGGGAGGQSVEYWSASYLGETLVSAEVSRSWAESGHLVLGGTTTYDYSAYLDYTATISEAVELDAEGALLSAEVHVVATVGALEYRERLSLDAAAKTATITRPSGTWTWAYESDNPVFYWNYASDLLLGFNQGTPISAEVLVRASRTGADQMDWIAHDYITVFPFAAAVSSSYSLGDTISVDGDGAITSITLRDLGVNLVPVNQDPGVTPVTVDHGVEDVSPPDCALAGTTETFEVISLDGTAVAGEVTWPEDHGGAAVTFNAGTGGADRSQWTGGLPRWDCLAAPFLDAGVAVVRYDDRGHGQSGGSFEEMTFTGRTEDAMAVARWTSEQPATQALYLLGHSEGVAHVSEVAAMADFEVAGLLLFAGVGDYSGLDVWTWQTRLYLEEHGFDPAFIDGEIDAMEQIADRILAGTYAQDTLGYYPTEFWADFFVFNGADLALEAGLPSFIAQGERDWQVPVDNGRSLRDALEAAGEEVTYYEVADVGHFLNRAPSDFPMTGDEYFLPIGWDQGLLDAMVGWVRDR